MHTLSCLSQLLSRPPLLPSRKRDSRNGNHLPFGAKTPGQALVIFAVALLALIFFIGLAVDSGSVYVTYAQLKRAVDASVVAAANDFKRANVATNDKVPVDRMTAAALEVLQLHNVDMTRVDLKVYVCDGNNNTTIDGIIDPFLATAAPSLYARCPDVQFEAPRKLVYVDAKMKAPTFFLTLLGIHDVPLETNAIAEAAPIDLVIVLDTSESMAVNTPGYVVDKYNPNDATIGCNPGTTHPNTCQPLLDAKNAAKALVDTLYGGYDRVSVVPFNSVAHVVTIMNKAGVNTDLSDDLTKVKAAIDAVPLHEDISYLNMWPNWRSTPGKADGSGKNIRVFNPVNPDDRDGDGADTDPNFFPTCTPDDYNQNKLSNCCIMDQTKNPNAKYRWDATKDPYGWGGIPCDDDYVTGDAYDWNGDGEWSYTGEKPAGQSDQEMAASWYAAVGAPGNEYKQSAFSPLSTCTGCGMRIASNVLKQSGRPSAVWVIVFLSDGIANMSDTPFTGGNIPAQYPNGFCWGTLVPPGLPSSRVPGGFWPKACIDNTPDPRYCIDTLAKNCPPSYTGTSVVWTGNTPEHGYSVLDYAKDMTDQAALTKSTNLDEPLGNEIAIYSVGLGDVSIGEELLRYMASVGDDGDRTTDPCQGIAAKKSCGQYYYAPSGAQLLPIFEDIATRIYTRITE